MNFPSSRSDYFLNLSKTDEKIETNLYIGLSEIWRKGGIPQPNTIVVDVPEISFKGTTNRITYHILLEYFNPYAYMYTSGLIFNVVDTFKCTQDVYLKTIALQMMLSEDGRLAGFTYDDGGVDEVPEVAAPLIVMKTGLKPVFAGSKGNNFRTGQHKP